MGCAPSKGKLFSKPDISAPQKVLLQAEAPHDVDCRPEEVEDVEAEEKDGELLVLADERATELDSDSTQNPKVQDSPREIISDVKQEDKTKEKGSQRKSKNKKRSSERQKKSQVKVDFPPQMVRAHQAAYTFLNPNISKYKTLLGLLDQAAHTQMSLQPVMTALVFQFEEINQALEEMAEEGELMLRQHGDYMALPSGMSGHIVRTITNHFEPPPDLVQQLLQHSAENMKQVGGSVKTLGDTTLQEVVDYFSSISKVMLKKLEAKQAAEHRLAEILAQVEGAAAWKPSAEDAALQSEDSGIGGENESLTGSEKRHRGSAGSCGSGANIQSAGDNFSDDLGHHENDEEEKDEEQEEDEDECSRPERNRSNSSPPDPSRAFHFLNGNFLQDLPTVQRPLTATNPEHSSELRAVSEIQGIPELGRPHPYSLEQKRHSLNGAYKSSVRANRTLSSPISTNRPPKRPSVRKLISTFSQGVNGRPGLRVSGTPTHVKGANKGQGLLVSDASNGNEGWFNGRSWPDGRDDLDMDNLPPPPLEVLMDDSFQSNEGKTQNEEGYVVRSLPMIHQRTGNCPRRKMPTQNLELLPNRANVRPNTVAMTHTQHVGRDAPAGIQLDPDKDRETEKANCLYQQARKIIHLRNAAESSDRTETPPSYHQLASVQAGVGQRFDSNDTFECEMASCSLPVIAPPVSRVRLPPSGPPVCHRHPSPPAFRPGSASRPTSRPSSPRTIISARDNPPEEIVPSVSFKDARSIFCRNESQNLQTGSGSRGRQVTRGADVSSHRTQSEKRPAGSSHPELGNSRALASIQAKGSETVTK